MLFEDKYNQFVQKPVLSNSTTQLNLSTLIWLLLNFTVSIVTASAASAASISLSSPLNIDFTGFTGSGFSPTPSAGQLSSNDWAITGFSDGNLAFGGTRTTGDFARGISTGGTATGGIYAYNVGNGNIALGVQPVGTDFTPGSLTLQLQNTGNTIDTLTVSYTIYVRNDGNRANSFNFSYSLDNISYNPVAALDFVSPQNLDANPSWVANPRSTTITGVNLTNGGNFYLRWTGNDVSGSNFRDGFALDDINVTAVPYNFSPSLGVVFLFVLWGLKKWLNK